MLPDTIIQAWRRAARIDEGLQAVVPAHIQVQRDRFQHLVGLSPDEARRQLEETDGEQNQALSWWLLDCALQLNRSTQTAPALNYVDWAEFIAQYRASSQHPKDSLAAH